MMDLDYFFVRLQSLFHVDLYRRESVIIFDEVQFQLLAGQAIKHLVKDGRYDYIETGSLINIKRNVKDILIPSEKIRMPLYPMDLDEFYWATGKEAPPSSTRSIFHESIHWGCSTPTLDERVKVIYASRWYATGS